MAVSTTTLAVRYAGNGSTSTAYVIPFPFLDTAHIFAAVSADGTAEPVLLEPGDYTVTRFADGSGGSLVTASAVSSPAEIIIFRAVPLTQPTVFQPAGPFPAKSNETALDRVTMILQQLNRRVNQIEGVDDEDYLFVPSGDPSSTVATAIWEDATARGSVVPQVAGQLGVEKATNTIWIAQSTTEGDWQEYNPNRTDRLVIGLVSDAGNPGASQTAATGLLTTWNPDAVLFAGNGNWNGAANYETDWAAFAPFITAGKAYPALGSLDLDVETWETLHAAKFAYLPGNRRYYNVVLGGGLVELFVLNSGFDSIGDLKETDGNEVGSVQHAWFVNAVNASKARWKIAVFHHPPASINPTEDIVAEEMAWPELAAMDLICCGHTHLLELLKWSDKMLVNLSAVSATDGEVAATIQGDTAGTGWPLWADDIKTGLGRIVATQSSLTVEVWSTGGTILHTRAHNDLSPRPSVSRTYTVVDANTAVGARFEVYVGTLSKPLILDQVFVSVVTPGGDPTDWTLHAGGVDVALGSIVVGDSSQTVDAVSGLEILPSGTKVSISTVGYSSMVETRGLEVTLIGRELN